MSNVTLSGIVNPTPRQAAFLSAVEHHRYTLYGGAAGGGKSYILRWALVWLLLRWFTGLKLTGVRVGLFCEDYPSLRDRHLSKIAVEFPAWLGQYRDGPHEFTLSPALGSGVVCFRNLDDPSKYLSSEFAAAAVDELTRNPVSTFDFLRMRLRWPGIEDTRFLGGTNPGGIGHAWVKSYWLDRCFPRELQPVANQFAFIKAKAADNPHLSQSYYDDLSTLPEHLRRAYADGDWDVFAGQYYPEWRRDIHVFDPARLILPPWWRRFRSLDYGLDMTACCWWAVSTARRLYIYRELYKPNLTLTQAAAAINDLTSADEKISYTVASPDLWNRRQDSGVPGEETMRRAGLSGLVRADDSRINGWRQLREYLTPYDDPESGCKTANLLVGSNCINLIRTLPALVHDDHDVEDVSDKCEDHGPESIRYGVQSRPPASVEPAEQQRRKRARQQATRPVVSSRTGY